MRRCRIRIIQISLAETVDSATTTSTASATSTACHTGGRWPPGGKVSLGSESASSLPASTSATPLENSQSRGPRPRPFRELSQRAHRVRAQHTNNCRLCCPFPVFPSVSARPNQPHARCPHTHRAQSGNALPGQAAGMAAARAHRGRVERLLRLPWRHRAAVVARHRCVHRTRAIRLLACAPVPQARRRSCTDPVVAAQAKAASWPKTSTWPASGAPSPARRWRAQ